MPDVSRLPPGIAARVSVRPAQSTDLDALTELEAKAFASDRLSRRRLRALGRSSTACCLVATSGRKLAGYVLVLTRQGSRTARLYSLAVDSAFAGRGVGRRLLRAAEAAAERRGAERLVLEVRADNAPAIRLYQQSGYAMIGRRDDYYEDGMTALRYGRRIRDPSRDASSKPLGRAA